MSWTATSTFYSQLGQMLKSGLEVNESIQLAARTAGKKYAGKLLHPDIDDRNKPISQRLTEHGEAPFIVALVKAGERSAELPQQCEEIATLYEFYTKQRNQFLSALAYPFLLIHAAMLIPPIIFSFAGKGPGLWALLGPFILWTLILTTYLFSKITRRATFWSLILEQKPFSLLSRPYYTATIARILKQCINAGLVTSEALETCAEGVGNPRLKEQLHNEARYIERVGSSLSDSFIKLNFPQKAIELCLVGEKSGKVPENLHQIALIMQERFNFTLSSFIKIVNVIIYIIAVLIIVSQIINIFGQYVAKMQSMT